jgi:imidazole glycerol phosphate synthase subunit HisF
LEEGGVMKKYLQLAVSLSALIAYGAVVCAGYFHARAQAANEACGVDCVMERVDALSTKTAALEHTVEQLTAQVGSSIKSGQTVTLHTQAGAGGGCLTFIGPSGDRGGYVSWNANCSHGTLWTIN